jgi:hypothetical protein
MAGISDLGYSYSVQNVHAAKTTLDHAASPRFH